MKKVGVLLLLTLFMSTSHAAIVQNQQYLLQDHPGVDLGGNYGLRVDALSLRGQGPTFSTQQGGARSILEWAGDTATITGTLYNNTKKALWTVSQTFSGVVAATGGFTATASVLKLTDPKNYVYIFKGRQDRAGNAFIADDRGYRCGASDDCGPLVGRGWHNLDLWGTLKANNSLTVVLSANHKANDWLVQLTPVPVPAALPLLASGLLGFSFISRKRKTS